MPLTREQMDRTIDEHFAFEAADNVQGVLETLAPDAVHDIVGWPAGPTRGREAARAFYEQTFADLAESKVTVIKRLYGDRFLVDESMWEGRAPGTPFGLEGRNRPLKFRLLHVVEFSDDGRIQRENVWLDMASIMQQLPQD
ncbi:MAG: ester cyclase [Phycisphaeraceae bacterium]|nr:ester cyclase [Phycisphaeraceae bacterium]